ncbi:hypothetical protein [Parolsenella catena]|uniref:hypothetical protein n=1 Tax=Parolsenella catena TaxID=2003188 RepID=UPI0020592F53|nr:MAG TPA: major tail protein [Caudoviricetes sp.]
MKFTQLPDTVFKNMQLNAGVLLRDFDPATATLNRASILGATSGGVKFTATPTYSDFGDDIDNCPANMKELKRVESVEVKVSGTMVTVTGQVAADLVGPADLDTKTGKVTPRTDIKAEDFKDLWWVGDYSEVNVDGAKSGKAGFVAIHMLNTLSTGGFSITTDNKAKGKFDFEFTAHYSIDDPQRVPYELYVKAGTSEVAA